MTHPKKGRRTFLRFCIASDRETVLIVQPNANPVLSSTALYATLWMVA
jgi:hypothetical protein